MTSLADLVSQMLEGGVAHTIVVQTIRVWEAREIPAEKTKPQSRIEKIRAYDRDRKAKAKTKIPDGNPVEIQTEIPGGILLTPLTNSGLEERSKAPLPPKPENGIPSETIHWAIDEWNRMAKAHGLAPVQSRSTERLRATKARMTECGGKDGWEHALVLVTKSPGLLGENDRGWKMDFDAFTSKKKFTKLMEGGYANWKPHKNNGTAFSQASAALHERIAERGFDFGHNGNGGPNDKTPPY